MTLLDSIVSLLVEGTISKTLAMDLMFSKKEKLRYVCLTDEITSKTIELTR